jgi:hypothetical protein
MPKPRGWSEKQLKKRDEIEQSLEGSGRSRSSSYAIATATVKKMKRKRKKGGA